MKNIRLISFFLIFILSSQLVYGQKVKYRDSGNIEITDTSIQKMVNGFYSYLLEEGQGKKFNASEYFVGITIVSRNDSTNHVEVTLSNYALTRPAITKLPGFYGFFKRGDINFIFWNRNKFIRKNKTISNPNVFKKFKRNRIVSTYDPYSWDLIFKNETILDMSPKETIEKYLH